MGAPSICEREGSGVSQDSGVNLAAVRFLPTAGRCCDGGAKEECDKWLNDVFRRRIRI